MDAPAYLLFFDKLSYLSSMDKSTNLVFCATVSFLFAVPLFMLAVLGNIRRSRRNSSRWMTFAVAAGSGIAFAVGTLIAPGSDVVVNALTTLSVIVAVAYICKMQTQRYPGARDRWYLRVLFTNSYWVLFTVFFISTWIQMRFPYSLPFLWSQVSPLTFVLLASVMLTWLVFTVPSAIVFFEAMRTRLPGFSLKIQNAASGILMTALSVDAVLWSANFWVRAFIEGPLRKDLVTPMIAITNITYVLEMVTVTVAVAVYYSRSEISKISEKLISFFQRTARIDFHFQNVPVHRHPYSGPYDYIERAANTAGFSLYERQKTLDTYRLAVLVYEGGISDAHGHHRISIRAFANLLALYDQDLQDPDIAMRAVVEHRRSNTYSLYELYETIEPLLTRYTAPSTHLESSERWLQLAYLGIQDATLVSDQISKQVIVSNEIETLYTVVKKTLWKEVLS